MLLKEQHPDLFEQAKAYEYDEQRPGSRLLERQRAVRELERPERMGKIKRNWEQTQEKRRKSTVGRKLVQIWARRIPEG